MTIKVGDKVKLKPETIKWLHNEQKCPFCPKEGVVDAVFCEHITLNVFGGRLHLRDVDVEVDNSLNIFPPVNSNHLTEIIDDCWKKFNKAKDSCNEEMLFKTCLLKVIHDSKEGII